MVNKLKQLGLYDDVRKRLILTNKLYTYEWNYIRLSEQSAAKFFDLIQDEMKEYYSYQSFFQNLTDQQSDIIKLLTEPEVIIKLRKKEEKIRSSYYNLIKYLNNCKRVVIVSAGEYCKRLVMLQEFLSMDFIEAVCDNSTDIQGTIRYSYVVESLKEAVKNHSDSPFLIANRKYSLEIESQLEDLGICKQQILRCTELPAGIDFLELCSEYAAYT